MDQYSPEHFRHQAPEWKIPDSAVLHPGGRRAIVIQPEQMRRRPEGRKVCDIMMKTEKSPSDELILVAPAEADEARVLDYREEHRRCGESFLHGSALLDRTDSYADWLKLVRGNTVPETVRSGWVVSDTLLAVRKSDDALVGMIDIRHELNDFLRECGGHIGYGVRPAERRKGYATEMLRLALEHARKLGLSEVLVACRRVNTGSRRTMEKNGGVLLREFSGRDGEAGLMFRIVLA